MNSPTTPVTVIGLGPMGHAMARTLLTTGHQVTLWNRTASRADDLVAEGAVLADSVAEAVAASPLVIVSLTDYSIMYELLDSAGDALAGRVVANLSSDTPNETRRAGKWLADRGAELITGGIMVPAMVIGTDGSYVFYGGREELITEHADTLSKIGRIDYRGEDVGLAQLWYQANLDVFLTIGSSFAHASALLRTAGVKATEFAPYARQIIELASDMTPSAEAIDSGEHPDLGASLKMLSASIDHVVETSRDMGIDDALPAASQKYYRQAIEAGSGHLGWTAIHDVMKKD